jgi:uncharacterized membrane protein
MKEVIKSLLDIMALRNTEIKSILPKPFRFLFCGVFTYGAYMIFKELGRLSTKQIDSIIANLIDPNWLLLGTIVVILALAGLWLSIIAVALFNSLVPKT